MSAAENLRSAQQGFTSPIRSAQQGFTLIEVLVALAIFGLAAGAALRLAGASASNAARLESRALGQIVARNIAIEAMLQRDPPAFGTSTGRIVNAGRHWQWRREIRRLPEPALQEIAVTVHDESGDLAGTLSLYRRSG